MTAAEKKMIEKNLDLLFEFEKYVLEHPEITEKIPSEAVVLMYFYWDQKFNQWSARWAKRQARRAHRSYRLRLRNWARFIRELKDSL